MEPKNFLSAGLFLLGFVKVKQRGNTLRFQIRVEEA